MRTGTSAKMKHGGYSFAILSGLLLGLASFGCASGTNRFEYPPARDCGQVDVMHGVEVHDPYRWLEEYTDETKAWIEAENKVTFAYLESIPSREKIKKRITDLWDYEKYGLPYKRGDRYFFSKNDGLQNQSVVYWLNALNSEPHVLIDPNELSEDGTKALSGSSVSEDGKLYAYSISDAGSDWQEWHVRDIDTGKDLDDHLKWTKFTGASWTKDNKGFYYSRYDEPSADKALQDVNYYNKLYYHRVGDEQSEDRLVYERRDEKEWGFSGYTTEDGRYLIIHVRKGTERKNQLYYKDLQGESGQIVELISGFHASYGLIGNDGPIFWLKTDDQAPRYRVIEIDIRSPDRVNWKEIIPETSEVLKRVSLVGGRFIASYMKDAYDQVKVYETDGRFVRAVAFPGFCSIYGFGGRQDDPETFYSFSSFATPPTIYRYDVNTGESEVFRRPDVDIDSDSFITKQIFYKSKDGTRIPMFITHKKGLVLDGNNPTLLYGYGGFNISISPSFSISRAVWMEMGGVYAVPNIRGGGEYGREWHEGGMKLNRQNVFDDFIAAAEWLIANKYTSTPKLAIFGGSNGGLLVGACMTQRPDLFGACLPAVGVLDMLRFHKFTIGWAWVSDYGCADNPEEFKVLRSYSPLHNLKPGTAYPATMITTGDHDDRVVPLHSFKFAAALQAAQSGPKPTLIRIETRAGHGAGKPTAMRIEEAADRWAFLVDQLGMNVD